MTFFLLCFVSFPLARGLLMGQLLATQEGGADPAALAKLMVDSFGSGQRALACFVGAFLLVIAARKWGALVWPWLGTSRGGVTLAIAAAAVVNIINDLQRGQALSAWVLLNALVVAVFNMGIWSGGKNVARAIAAYELACKVDGYKRQKAACDLIQELKSGKSDD